MDRKRALIVDDDPDILEFLAEALEDLRIDVEKAEDPITALKIAASRSFDVILTDLRMPNLSGTQFVACLRLSQRNAKTPVIAVSGYLSHFRSELAQLALTCHYEKGVEDASNLVKLVEAAITQKHKSIEGYHEEMIGILSAAAHELFRFYFPNGVIAEDKLQVEHRKRPQQGFATGVLCIFGPQIYGSIALVLDRSVITRLATQLLGLQPGAFQPDDFTEIAGEMANQFAGLLKIKLSERDYKTVIGIPQLLSGDDHKIPRFVANPVGVLPFHINDAHAWIEFCLGDPQMLIATRWEPEAKVFLYR